MRIELRILALLFAALLPLSAQEHPGEKYVPPTDPLVLQNL